VRELVDGLTGDGLQMLTGAPLRFADDLRVLAPATYGHTGGDPRWAEGSSVGLEVTDDPATEHAGQDRDRRTGSSSARPDSSARRSGA